jgi:putative tricarboxylic transport membrane protein
MILLFCIVGVYSVNNSAFDIGIMVIFGVFGYIMRKCDYEFAPLVLAYVLGPMLERAMRQSLLMSKGSFTIFLNRPISAVCLIICAFLLIMSSMRLNEKKTC